MKKILFLQILAIIICGLQALWQDFIWFSKNEHVPCVTY